MATFTKTVSALNIITADPDWTAPTIDRTVIAKSTGYLANYVKQDGTYYVYANVTDTGNPASGMVGPPVGTVRTDESAITSGQNNVALVAGSYSVNGQTYNYRTAIQTATNPLGAGAKTYSLTPTDSNGNTLLTTGFPVTVDNTAPIGHEHPDRQQRKHGR